MDYSLNLIAERQLVRESLKGIIWTIFFHRLFGPITPTTSEFLQVPYPLAAGMPKLDVLINDKIDLLVKKYFGKSGEIQNGKVVIQFYDITLKKKKKSGWFGSGKDDTSEKKLWEKWTIYVRCLPIDSCVETNKIVSKAYSSTSLPINSDKEKLKSESQQISYLPHNFSETSTRGISVQSFENNIANIIDISDSYKSHIPSITSLESMPFPYDIDIEGLRGGEFEKDKFGSTIRKILN